MPTKLIGKSTSICKKAIGGFGGMKGGCYRGGTKEDDEILNRSGRI